MSDDLIKRDDALATIDTFKRNFEQPWKVQFSADIRALPAVDLSERIEELESEVKEYHGEAMDWIEKWGAAEAKLAKAVEALRSLEFAATGAGVHHPQERRLLHEAIHKTRVTLAELEGK